MKRHLICTVCFFAFYAGSVTTAEAQLFDDLEKRENVSTNGWVFGADLGFLYAYYNISPERLDSDNFTFLGGSYTAPGFHVGGVVLRSFDGVKVGGALSFQRFTGTDEVTVLGTAGTAAAESEFSDFREVSLNALNISARGEIPVMSSVEGGMFMVVDLGVAILSGDFPGSSVSAPLRGGFGFGYEFRLTDKTNLQVEFMLGLTRFQNEMGERELTHFLFASCLSAGLRF